jgi:hypothetical protein
MIPTVQGLELHFSDRPGPMSGVRTQANPDENGGGPGVWLRKRQQHKKGLGGGTANRANLCMATHRWLPFAKRSQLAVVALSGVAVFDKHQDQGGRKNR